jgi:hypothetical protein
MRAVTAGLGIAVGELAPDGHIVDYSPVRIGQLRKQESDQALRIVAYLLRPHAQVVRHRGRAGLSVFADVGPGHPGVPVETLSIRRRDTDQHRRAEHAVFQQSGAGQRVRPAAGAADHAKLIHSQ